MKILLAFDKFKDALSAREAGRIVAAALAPGRADWEFAHCPLTDGGEGFAEILTSAAGGTLHRVRVVGPRGKLVTAKFGLVKLGKIPPAAQALLALPSLPMHARIAVLEMAQASGLALLGHQERDPWRTSTRGTGQMMRAAIKAGAQAVILGVGGSATHDLGLGALNVLGVKFHQADGRILRSLEPASWGRLVRITAARSVPGLPIRIACDVTNPLLGRRGAAKTYAPQKGLRSRDYARLEKETTRVAAMLCEQFAHPSALRDVPGAGAAGGLSFGLMCALRARLLPGFELISAWVDLPVRLAAADVVVTGEGRFDRSSFHGKGPGSVVERALALGKPVHVFAGRIAVMPRRPGLRVHAITPRGQKLGDALREAERNLAMAARRAFVRG